MLSSAAAINVASNVSNLAIAAFLCLFPVDSAAAVDIWGSTCLPSGVFQCWGHTLCVYAALVKGWVSLLGGSLLVFWSPNLVSLFVGLRLRRRRLIRPCNPFFFFKGAQQLGVAHASGVGQRWR
jgi:hypothetical protein